MPRNFEHRVRLISTIFGVLFIQAFFAYAPTNAKDVAEFTVTSDVINTNLPAFDATMSTDGNGDKLTLPEGVFEPVHFRYMLRAEADADNQIIASPSVLSMYDSWPQGAFDGADIEVLRIVNGAFETVRRDKIPTGGFRASGWTVLQPTGKIIPPGKTSAFIGWDGYNRLDAPEYFQVQAVDTRGNLSPASQTVTIIPPQKPQQVDQRADVIDGQITQQASTSLVAPQNVTIRMTVNRTALISWDPVPGAAGYVIRRSDLPPNQIHGFGITLAGAGAPIRKGDLVLLRKAFMLPPRAEIATHRVWSAYQTTKTFGNRLLPGFPGDPNLPPFRLQPYGDTSPVPDGGETYLQVDLLQDQDFRIGSYNHAGTDQRYYEVLDPNKTYRFEVWARAKGDVTLSFDFVGGIYRGKDAVPGLPGHVKLTSQWTRYVIDFKVPFLAKPTHPGMMQMILTGKGQVDVDNFRIYRADAQFNDFLPEDIAALKASGLGALRTHQYVRTGISSYDLSGLLNGSFPHILKAMADLKINPWLQIEMHLSPEEWQGFVEYMSAPFDPTKDDPKTLPWAAKRVAQGRIAPWTDAFDKIYFELSNETWNMLFRPWTFPSIETGSWFGKKTYTPGEVYGLYQEHVLNIMRQSPWWGNLSERLEPVIGGWMIHNYGVDALRMSPHSTVLTNADYIGGWDANEGPVQQTPESYASVMAFAPQTMGPNAVRLRTALKDAVPNRNVITGTYEAGPGYAKNGLNGQNVTPEQMAEQEKVMKSAASGTATLDSFLTRAVQGDRIQNFFVFGRGDQWTSHALWFDGGQAYPAWQWLTLFNREALGDLLSVTTQATPTRDLGGLGRRTPLDNAPMAAVYATRRGDRLTVVVVSREIPNVPTGSDGHMEMTVNLPIQSAQRVTRYMMTGTYQSENTKSEQARIISDTMAFPAGQQSLHIDDLPPAATQVYVFDGVQFSTP